MDCSNSLAELSVTICQFICGYLSFHYLGFWLGLLVIILAILLYKLITEKLFQMEALTSADKILLSDYYYTHQMVLAQLDIDDYKEDVLNNILIQVFMKVPKLRYVLTYRLFNFWWVESKLPFAEIIKQRIIIHEAMNEKQVEEFKKDQLQKELDKYSTPIVFHLIPKADSGKYPLGKGYMFIKFDHCLTDGMGILSLMLCSCDNFDKSLFPKVMVNRIHSLWDKAKDFILFLFFGIPIILYLIIATKSAYRLSKIPRSRNTSYTEPISFDLNLVKKRCKDLSISINELFMSLILTSLKEIYPDGEKINFEVPIGLSPIPESINEVKLSNHVFGLFYKMRLIKDIIQDYKIFKDDYKSMLKQALFARVSVWGTYFVFAILPFNWAKKIAVGVMEQVDLCSSNLPGPEAPILLGNCKVVNVLAYATLGYLPNFFPIISYDGKIKMVGLYDNEQDFDAISMINTFETHMNKILNGKETIENNEKLDSFVIKNYNNSTENNLKENINTGESINNV